MKEQQAKIECPSCESESFLRRDPVYDGFRRVGERLFCASCGHEFADEASIPLKKKAAVSLFGMNDKPAPVRIFKDEEKPEPVKVFEQDENKRLCRYCDHYVINPFIQRCARLKKEVEATDTCGDFVPKKKD